MVKLYCININESIRANNLINLMRYVSQYRIQKAMEFYDLRDLYRSLLGEMIARYAICILSDCSNSQIVFDIGTYGKPKLKFPKGHFFNISHSGDWVVCAISDNEVGIDIEQIKETKTKVAKRFFSSEEYKIIKQCKTTEDQKKMFYTLWTLKESYVKADGRGLSLLLNSFSISFNDKDITLNSIKGCQKYNFRTFYTDTLHFGAVCSFKEIIDKEIKEVSIYEVIEFLEPIKVDGMYLNQINNY